MITPERPPEEPKPRGRAASPIRTGHFIRDKLEEVGEASIAELHSMLISQIGRENALRAKADRLRAPTYESFYKYFDRVRRLGLVEWVTDKPMVAFWGGQMISIRVGALEDTTREATVVQGGTQRVYRLSELGKRPEMTVLWDDPLARGLMREMMLAAIKPQ
jgi:hypothetical protein